MVAGFLLATEAAAGTGGGPINIDGRACMVSVSIDCEGDAPTPTPGPLASATPTCPEGWIQTSFGCRPPIGWTPQPAESATPTPAQATPTPVPTCSPGWVRNSFGRCVPATTATPTPTPIRTAIVATPRQSVTPRRTQLGSRIIGAWGVDDCVAYPHSLAYVAPTVGLKARRELGRPCSAREWWVFTMPWNTPPNTVEQNVATFLERIDSAAPKPEGVILAEPSIYGWAEAIEKWDGGFANKPPSQLRDPLTRWEAALIPELRRRGLVLGVVPYVHGWASPNNPLNSALDSPTGQVLNRDAVNLSRYLYALRAQHPEVELVVLQLANCVGAYGDQTAQVANWFAAIQRAAGYPAAIQIEHCQARNTDGNVKPELRPFSADCRALKAAYATGAEVSIWSWQGYRDIRPQLEACQ